MVETSHDIRTLNGLIATVIDSIDGYSESANDVDQCRRLAGVTHDEKMRWQLIEWANEIEADIVKLEAERQLRNRS